MCGRFTLKSPAAEIARELFPDNPTLFSGVDEALLRPRFNIAPTQSLLSVVAAKDVAGGAAPEGHLAVKPMRWGLVPSWSDDLAIGNQMINARSETVAEKRSFKKPFEKQRCLIPADGYYEWQATGGKTKQPFWIHRPGERVFALGGIWETNRRAAEQPIVTCSLLTTTPNDNLAAIHDRMPVIIQPEDFERWLDPEEKDLLWIQSRLKSTADDYFEARPVSTMVNNPRNDREDLIAQVAG